MENYTKQVNRKPSKRYYGKNEAECNIWQCIECCLKFIDFLVVWHTKMVDNNEQKRNQMNGSVPLKEDRVKKIIIQFFSPSGTSDTLTKLYVVVK